MKNIFYWTVLIFKLLVSFFLIIENNVSGSEIDSLKSSNNHFFNTIGLREDYPVDKDLFQIIKMKLDSSEIILKKKIRIIEKINTQIEDGYEWGGGETGFQNFLNDNMDKLLNILSKEDMYATNKSIYNTKEILKNHLTGNSADNNIIIEDDLEFPIIKMNENNDDKGSTLSIKPNKTKQKISKKKKHKKKEKKKEKKSKKGEKPKYFGLEVSPGINYPVSHNLNMNIINDNIQLSFKLKYLTKVTFLRLPISPSFEVNNYRFLSNSDSIIYSGYSYRVNSDFNLSGLIKIGGDKFYKGFSIGAHGNGLGYGLTAGTNLEYRIGSTPLSVAMGFTIDIFNSELNDLSYWSLAGIHLKYSFLK